MQGSSIFDTDPNNGIQSDMTLREILVAQDKIPRTNPAETLDDERVQTVMRFYNEAKESEKRKSAVGRWQQADRFIDGEQWTDTEVNAMDPHQAQLTINRVFPVQETRVAMMTENLVQVEVLPRDAADDTFAKQLDGFLIHEWERQGWSSVFAITLWQASAHSTAFIKTYWDVHGDGGRGVAKLEPVSNYDLFIHQQARIRDGKLIAKYVIHRFELTRNQILQIYNQDIVETPPEVPNRARQTKGDPQTSALLGADATDTIFMTGKPTSRSATDDSRAPDYVRPKDVYEVLECWYMDDEMVETEEFDDLQHRKTKPRYPNGRILTVSNGRLLYDAPNELGFFPFVPITERPTISEIYPPSTINHLVQPQKEYNRRRSQLSDHAELCCNPIMVITSMAALEQDSHINKPGSRLVSMDGQSPNGGINYLIPPPLGDEVGEGVALAHQDIDEISGMHEVNRGEEPSQARSGVALNILQQSGKTRTSWHSDNNDVGLKQIYQNLISMHLDFTSEPRKFRFVDPDSLTTQFGDFDPQGHVLPNRRSRIMELQEQIQSLEAQKLLAMESISEEEMIEMSQLIDRDIEYLLREIEIVEQMPASDLISFDVSIMTGTRHLSQQAKASLAVQLKEMNVIEDTTLLSTLQFPGWKRAILLKREEDAAIAEATTAMAEAEFERERQLAREKSEQNILLEMERAETRIESEEASTEGEIKLQEEKSEDAIELERIRGENALRVARARPRGNTTKKD